MKKFLKYFFVLFGVFSALNAHTNKTFLMPRAAGVNAALDFTTFNEKIFSDKQARNKSNFALTAFYQQSDDKRDIGRYFGIKSKNKIIFNDNNSQDVNPLYLIHYRNAINANYATIKLEPRQKIYNLRLDYYQDLEEILSGLYLKCNLPFVHLKNSMHMSVFDAYNQNTTDFYKNNIKDFFSGSYGIDYSSTTRQKQLSDARIGESKSATGIADIDIALGYKLVSTNSGYLALNAALTIPTGNAVKGENLFEPIYGNGRHFGFGGGFDTEVKFCQKEDSYFKFSLLANYRYLINGTEKRTLSLKNKDFAHYFLIGQVGDTTGTPAANLLTRDLKITPRSQIDSLAAFSYQNGGWSFDLGYNLFWRESEAAKLKKSWTDGQYALVALDWDTHNALDLVNTYFCDGNNLNPQSVTFANSYQINKDKFDFDSVRTPTYISHKIFAGIGYIFENWKNPCLLGIGGSYEFAQNNAALENWAAWIKFGVSF